MASLWSQVVASGDLSERKLVGLNRQATWRDLVDGALFACDLAELRGKSIVLATNDQFLAAATLVQLDGVARRIVLCPPDVPLEHFAYITETAEAEIVLTDREDVTAQSCGVNRIVGFRNTFVPTKIDHDSGIETEWILLTSGTTGRPKLAVHTLASLAGSAWEQAAPGTVWSTFYDMRRYGGMHIFLHAALTGTSLIVSSADESVADFLARAAAHGVTNISGTPSHWRRALMSPAIAMISPRYIRMSGEIVDQAILNQVKAQFPNAMVAHTFASTEAGVGFNVNDGLMGFPEAILTSNPLIEMKIQDGTLRIRSKRTATRYLGAASPVLADVDGFVDTGDTIDLRDGRYYFSGRRDGVINVGGKKVHPEEVEAVLNLHDDVAMSMVKAKKNPITGALVVADVVLRRGEPNGEAANLQTAILQFCRGALDAHKVPVSINFVPALTVGQSGKLVRRNA